jgi:glycosyltransferase involved in cell wall biosynthesis
MISSKPDVSVIIASYNRLWALPTAVESCRNNRCLTEIIVVDDGSTDDTWPWLQTQKDVVSIRTDNWGECWARNTGSAASTGEFIRFLDSDDWLLDGATDRQLEIARATNADVVVSGYEQHDQVRGRKIDIPWVRNEDFLVGQIESDYCYSAYLMRRSIVASIPHREEYPHHDSTFLMELGLTKPKVAIAPFSSVAYRVHNNERQSDLSGIATAVAAVRSIILYKRILVQLSERGECTTPRKNAVLRALWNEARKLAEGDMKAAAVVVEWIRNQDARFAPPVNRAVNALYHLFGFKMTERIAQARRIITQ